MVARNTQYATASAMPIMRRLKMARRLSRASAAALAILLWHAVAHAADCPRKGALGTSRVMAVDAAIWPRIGSREIGRASCRKECRSRWSPYHYKKKET